MLGLISVQVTAKTTTEESDLAWVSGFIQLCGNFGKIGMFYSCEHVSSNLRSPKRMQGTSKAEDF